MKELRVFEEFDIQRLDDDGFEIENEIFTIRKHTLWQLSDGSEMFDEYFLTQIDKNTYGYMTINKATLDSYFEQIN